MTSCLGVCGSARDRRVGNWNRRNGEQYRRTIFLPGRGSRKVWAASSRRWRGRRISPTKKSRRSSSRIYGRRLKRFATVDESAAIATYLASERSSATNGAALRVDGGVLKAI